MKGIFFVGEIRREEFEDFPYEWREKRKSPLIWRIKEIPPEILRGGGRKSKGEKGKKNKPNPISRKKNSKEKKLGRGKEIL